VFDCGTIHVTNMEAFGLKKEEVATRDLAGHAFSCTSQGNASVGRRCGA
jgi:hypothetical protein